MAISPQEIEIHHLMMMNSPEMRDLIKGIDEQLLDHYDPVAKKSHATIMSEMLTDKEKDLIKRCYLDAGWEYVATVSFSHQGRGPEMTKIKVGAVEE